MTSMAKAWPGLAAIPVAVLALPFVLAAGPAQADTCAQPNMNFGCFATIQEAVDNAGAGDTVRVFPGVYNENVVIIAGKDGLTLEGVGFLPDNKIIDATIPAVLGDPPNTSSGIDVLSANVTIARVTVRNVTSGGGIDADAAGLRVDRVLIRNVGSGDCIDIIGDDGLVENSRFLGCDNEAISVSGNGVTIRRNTMQACDGDCIDIDGDNALVERNRISLAEDGDCIDIDGDFAVVRQNFGRSCSFNGVDVDGENPVVVGNEMVGISEEAYLIDCDPCSGGEVRDNNALRINDFSGRGFDLFAAAPGGLVVRDNRATQTARSGLEVSGTAITLRGNQAEATGFDGNDPGFDIFGTGHQLFDNLAQGNYHDGYEIDGDDHVLEDNRAIGNFQDGFDVGASATNVTLDDNRAERNTAMGIEVSSGATDTVVENNVAQNNPVDFCDEGTNTTENGNSFGTTSTVCYVD